MRLLTIAASVIALAVAVSAPARAATFLFESGPASDGSLSWDFGNDGDILAGAFTDDFLITIPDLGTGAGSVEASFTSPTNDLLFTSVTFDGFAFHLFDLPGDHVGNLVPTPIPAGTFHLIVEGISPGDAGSYDGHLTFSPAAVPEPASWALMILGMGSLGALLRNRRQRGALAV
jgi:hypothetical protein